jgi:hypothetical protein
MTARLVADVHLVLATRPIEPAIPCRAWFSQPPSAGTTMTFEEANGWCLENGARLSTVFDPSGMLTTLSVEDVSVSERLRSSCWGAWKATFVILVERARRELARSTSISGTRPIPGLRFVARAG